MTAQIIFILILGFLLFDYFLGLLLGYLNASVRSEIVPNGFQDVYDAERYRKAMQYDRVNQRFSLISGTFSLIVIFAALVFDLFSILDSYCVLLMKNEIIRTLVFAGVLGVASGILSLPFSWYHTFVIEEKFGFNKSTKKTFVLDFIKSAVLTAILGGLLISAFVIFYYFAGPYFWLYAWILMAVVMLFFSMFYTSLIVPLFNKLSPLPDGELRDAISDFANVAGFKLKNIYVIDGSKRSSKANAFFSGFGKGKKIMLYDTLIQEMSTEETVAVLAHEAGHYHYKHTMKGMFSGLIQTLVLFYLFSLIIDSSMLSQALGGSAASIRLNTLCFAFLFSPVSTLLGIAGNWISRKHEYNADAYAARMGKGSALISSLKNLSANHLSNLKPHPWYVFFHYSHPPLLKRVMAISNQIK